MTKENFYKLFKDEEEFLIGKLWDDIELVLNINFPILTKIFFPGNIWATLASNSLSLGVSIKVIGLNETSEKKILLIVPKDYDLSLFNFQDEVIFFKIDGANKFYQLQHKDFLGAIMSIGIKRELLGDLIVKDNICFGITTEEIFKIILEEIDTIGKVPIKFSKISSSEIPKTEFNDIYITSTSLRIDSILSELINSSRNSSLSKISLGEVLINYNPCREKNTLIKKGDIITIRKIGKFKFEENLGESKKGKFKLLFKQWA